MSDEACATKFIEATKDRNLQFTIYGVTDGAHEPYEIMALDEHDARAYVGAAFPELNAASIALDPAGPITADWLARRYAPADLDWIMDRMFERERLHPTGTYERT